MNSVNFIFPHQLFAKNPLLTDSEVPVFLLEDSLFFGDSKYPLRFHRQKLQCQLAGMDFYQDWLAQQGISVARYCYDPAAPALERAFSDAGRQRMASIRVIDPVDFLLSKRLEQLSRQHQISLATVDSPGFLNTSAMNNDWRNGRKRWFMADFYQWQRQRLNILMDDDKPAGGRWSFDTDNRKKLPRKALEQIPALPKSTETTFHRSAMRRITQEFSDHPGCGDEVIYPATHQQARDWLTKFLEQRLGQFGPYEDAIVAGQHWLYHSVLTPCMNIGLITPQEVIEQTLNFASQHHVPLASLEGFIRQIIGWREFMRATYEDLGVTMRTRNHWGHSRKIPKQFYSGETGITPIDDLIQKILATGYCHHIERLMILGSFFFLCEFEPDDVYDWFMALFVDSYDWVMVPNVYSMSQNADGGLTTTKPYFCGSNYILKMSHYKKPAGSEFPATPPNWAEIWDGLYWRWIFTHQAALGKNPRWVIMCRQIEKMDEEVRTRHLDIAKWYLKTLDTNEDNNGRRIKA